MGRLKALRPQVSPLVGTVSHLPTDGLDIERSRASGATKHWYNLARWRKLRLATFVRDRFRCQMCGRAEGRSSKLVCDHVKPHRGNEELFWDENNLQTLCKSPCHDKHKQMIERSAPGG